MERDFGRMIQRTTLLWIMGVREVEWREERKEGNVVVGVRERRWRVQSGILAVCSLEIKRIGSISKYD